jgi:hypothetical protein
MINVVNMQRRICSYDKMEVPAECYTVTEEDGDIYLCDPRCLCLWSVQRATRSHLVEVHRGCTLVLTAPAGGQRSFTGIVELAQWATANALGGAENEWFKNGRDLL